MRPRAGAPRDHRREMCCTYALTELHDPEAIELFITEEDAQAWAARIVVWDEPQQRGRLEVTDVELDHEHTSLN